MARRTFTLKQISKFQWLVARGARITDLSRKHGFSVSTFQRWGRKYGTPIVFNEPNDEERALARSWREARTPIDAWRRFRDFATLRKWHAEVQLPLVDDQDQSLDFLELMTRPDTRVVLIVEKLAVRNLLQAWRDRKTPSVAHSCRVALAYTPPFPSEWASGVLSEHATSMGAKLGVLADLDPEGLLAYGAVRSGGIAALLAGKARPANGVQWLGIDDRLLEAICGDLGSSEIPAAWMINLRWLEREYWDLVKTLIPDVRKVIGHRSFDLLERGAKIEIDALISFAAGPLAHHLRERLSRLGRSAHSR
jgi:hypothetical protein